MPSSFTRRQLLVGAGRFGAFLTAFELARKSMGLVEQHRTWQAAAEGNDAFFQRNEARLRDFELGGSFAPEQWPLDAAGQRAALAGLDLAVRELHVRRMRLGIRWSRVDRGRRGIDLSPYRPLLDYCFSNGVAVCLNPGPIRTFRWPEEHVPTRVLTSLSEVPTTGATISPSSPLAQAALSYLERLLEALENAYDAAALRSIEIVQAENEPFYPLGEHAWVLGPAYLQTVAHRLHAAFPWAGVMLTTAGRLNMTAIRDVLFALKQADSSYAGKLVSGFDFHYRTPNRDSYPIIRYFDQITYARPGVAGTNDNIADSRLVGYRIEVTEGQMEPYGHFQQPGNSATDLRYMLQRCIDHVLDPEQPALVRLWGIEELVKKMLTGALTNEHRQIIGLIQRVNSQRREEVRGR